MANDVMMVTIRGRAIRPGLVGLAPDDIALHLGRTLRWGGVTSQWWTVLQHSLVVFELARDVAQAPADVRLWALLHDAHEMFTGDVPRPLKTPGLRAQQDNLDRQIAYRLGLPFEVAELDRLRAAVKPMDDLAMAAEANVVAPGVRDGSGADSGVCDLVGHWEAESPTALRIAERHVRLNISHMEATGVTWGNNRFAPGYETRAPLVAEWLAHYRDLRKVVCDAAKSAIEAEKGGV
ncbi:hypothetical protein KQI63_15695 [bacterium]|nr:hypothetical protein [bacterium]